MSKSSVAGVLDGYGGMRVLVTERWRMKNHVRPHELLVLVPGLRVREPVPWNEIPGLIAKVERYALEWVRGLNTPDLRDHDAVKLYLLRRQRTYQTNTVNLYDIVET